MAQASAPASGDAVLSTLKERTRDLYKYLPLAMAGQEEPIHQVRVVSRRLRVLLVLGARKPEGRKVRRALEALKQLGRAAGKSRDLDVALGLFAKESEIRGKRVAPVLRALAGARRSACRRMSEAFLDMDVSRLRRDLRAVLARGAVDATTVRLRLRIMREEAGGDLIRSIERLGHRFDPEALHDIRSGGRRLRYAAELDGEIEGRSLESVTTFREAQGILGEIHDAWMLSRWLGQWAEAAEARGRHEASEGRKLESSCEDLSRTLHAKFLEWDPASKLRGAVALLGRSSSDPEDSPGDDIHAITVHPTRHRGAPWDAGHRRRQTSLDLRRRNQVPRGRTRNRAHRRPS